MVIVTGATGFIGTALVWELNQHGLEDVICVDTVSPEERPSALARRKYTRFLRKDDLWPFLAELARRGARPAWVIHLGACSSTTETNVEFLRENNTLYTQRLFEWCSQELVPLIYASSGATYGAGEKGFDDKTPPDELHALNPYGESKLAFDRWVSRVSETPPQWYGLRFFNVYGPGEEHKGDMASVVYKAFHQIRETGTLRLFRSHRPDYKDGMQVRDFVYVKDITHWIWQILNMEVRSGIYNMGFGQARTWIDLATSVFGSMEQPVNIEWMDIPERLREQYQYKTLANIEGLMGQGLSKPQWSLEEGIGDYVRNHLMRDGPSYL